MQTILIITQSASILIIGVLLIWRHERTKIIHRQDKDALQQNLLIQDKDKFIEELIKSRPTKDKHTFRQRLEDLSKKQNLENLKT